MLRVVTCKPMSELYYNALLNTAKKMSVLFEKNPELKEIDLPQWYIKQIIFYGMKAVNSQVKPETGYTEEMLKTRFEFFNLIINYISFLTPTEFITIFPIDKTFDGDKCETKDYFSTMEFLIKIRMDEPIGEENTLNLLWSYCNWNVRYFNVNFISLMSDLRQLDGQTGIMEQWADDNGITLNSLHTDPTTGLEYMINNDTHRSIPIKSKAILEVVT